MPRLASADAVGQCSNDCGIGDIDEGEECPLDEYADLYNGGCNWDPPFAMLAFCNETFCGSASTYDFGGQDYRDTDWYLIEQSELYDVVVVLPVLGSIQVFRNLGDGPDGDWIGFLVNPPIALGANPSAVISGLFNDDPHLHLAVTNRNTGAVSILINNGLGDATFTITQSVPVGAGPSAGRRRARRCRNPPAPAKVTSTATSARTSSAGATASSSASDGDSPPEGDPLHGGQAIRARYRPQRLLAARAARAGPGLGRGRS